MRIQALFNQAAQTYDQHRRLLIPCFDDFYGTALDLIPFDRNQPIQILDLGAGTGLLSALAAQAFPAAHVTLIDISDEMLAQAQARFIDYPNRFHYRVADYAQVPFTGPYDVIMSALSIHHLTDTAKTQTFQQAYEALNPDGMLINADQILGPTPAIDQHYHQTWLHQVQEQGVDDTVLSAALERMQEDKTSPLAVQLEWLKQAGFHHVHCWYKNHFFAVYSGQKVSVN